MDAGVKEDSPSHRREGEFLEVLIEGYTYLDRRGRLTKKKRPYRKVLLIPVEEDLP